MADSRSFDWRDRGGLDFRLWRLLPFGSWIFQLSLVTRVVPLASCSSRNGSWECTADGREGPIARMSTVELPLLMGPDMKPPIMTLS